MVAGKRIFITGGAGFIGSYLCEELLEDNHVTIFDNLRRNALRYTSFGNHPDLTLVKGDVLDHDAVQAAMTGHDIVIHCAGVAGIYSVVENPTLTIKANFLGTYNALEAAVANDIQRFVYFSTSEVYGVYVFKGTEDSPTSQGPVGHARWSYAVSKLAAEHLAKAYQLEYRLPVIIVRPFNVYGPRQVGEGAVREFVLKAIKGLPLILYNDGTQIRAWCYVEDFVHGILAGLEREDAIGNVFNLGNPQAAVTNLELARLIIRIAGSRSQIVFKEHPGPEVEIRIPSIDKARQLLGYSPRVDLELGITKTIEWYCANGDL